MTDPDQVPTWQRVLLWIATRALLAFVTGRIVIGPIGRY
jgi:hypothetical protein